MLKIDNLSFAYKKGVNVLNDISLELGSGFYALVGKNGCGKSTLMKLICASLKCSPEAISIDGIKVNEHAYAEKISYLPQIFDPYPNLSVKDILYFVAGLKGIKKKDIPAKIAEAGEKTNITQFFGTRFGKCSEGMKHRVGIAAALLGDRDVIILDEPTAGLDPAERARFYETVRSCFEGKTVLLSTHILEDVEYLADNIIMISGGKITYRGTFSEYCKALDGRLYTASVPSAKKASVMILSESRMANGTTISRIVSDTPLPVEWNPESAEPTKEDVWNYFERAYNE